MRFYSAMILPALLLAGCAGSLVNYRSPETGARYHPPPAAFRTTTLDLGSKVPAALRTPEVRLAYASTCRPGGTSFSDEPDGVLHLGRMNMRIGPVGTTWDDLVDWARLNEHQIPPVRVELTAIDRLTSDPDSTTASFLAALEPMYEHGGRRVLIFVHGDDTSFAEAAATLACMHHHQGRRGASVLFSWPAGSVEQRGRGSARDSCRRLAELITLLSGPGRAGRIDCLADASGAAVLTGAMHQIEGSVRREGMPGLHLGSIVLASPEVVLKDFVSQDLDLMAATARRTVIYIDRADLPRNALGLMAQHERVEMVDITDLPGPKDTDGFTGHGAWSANPLVVTDALFTLLAGLPAAQRGLVHDRDTPVWILPPDYALRAAAGLRAIAEASSE